MAHPTELPLVMIWRRVHDLPSLRPQVDRIYGWHEVSADGYSVMYDAGTVLVAYWQQSQLLLTQAEETADTTCTIETQLTRTSAFNPSNQLILAVEDTGGALRRLSQFAGRSLRPSVRSDRTGEAISFVDEVGNTTRYLRPAEGRSGEPITRRVRALDAAGFKPNGSFHPVVGYELLASDLETSREFYEDVLRLRAERSGDDEVIFDTGNLPLILRREPTAGLVTMVRGTGKLKDDLVVFHHPDVESAVYGLSRRGARFPNGIEDSPHGRLATFEDPDGHALSVWQPPTQDRDRTMNHFAVLERLLVGPSSSLGGRLA